MIFNKKIIFLTFCISILLCFLTIQETYAKYSTSNNTTTNMSIARWRILVNDFDVRNNLSQETVIEPVFSGNSNIADGYIAPTATGYFDVLIDATDTDVSFSYSITVGQNTNNEVDDLIITGYSIGTNGTVQNYTNSGITGSISNAAQDKTISLRIYVTWNDGVGSTMNNAADTATTGDDATAKLDVSFNFIQNAS